MSLIHPLLYKKSLLLRNRDPHRLLLKSNKRLKSRELYQKLWLPFSVGDRNQHQSNRITYPGGTFPLSCAENKSNLRSSHSTFMHLMSLLLKIWRIHLRSSSQIKNAPSSSNSLKSRSTTMSLWYKCERTRTLSSTYQQTWVALAWLKPTKVAK